MLEFTRHLTTHMEGILKENLNFKAICVLLFVFFIMTTIIGCASNSKNDGVNGESNTDSKSSDSTIEYITTNESTNNSNDAVSVPKTDTNKPMFIVDEVLYQAKTNRYAVNIYVVNNPGIASIAVTLDYDRDKLKLTDFSFNADIGGQSVPYNSNVPEVKLVWLNWESDVKGDWVFATLYFEVLDSDFDKYEVSLRYDPDDVYNAEEQNIQFDVINGGITRTN